MKKERVLILGVASVQMDAIIQLKKMGYETYACAMANDGPGAAVADYFEPINFLDVDAVIRYIKENNISLVYSVGSDMAMPIACEISEQLELPHFISEKTARICNNKDQMRTTLGQDFKGNINYQIITNKDDEVVLDYPFILKPTDSQGQRGVILINSYDEYINNYEIARKYSRSGVVIIEEYVTGPEISVNGYMVDGELRYLVASDRDTWPEYTGLIHKHIVPSSKLDDNGNMLLREIILSACNRLNINNGPVYAQMKIKDKTPIIIEITPRLDGCHMWNVLSHYSGVNLLKLTFEHLLNNNISELNNQFYPYRDEYTLEFICQKPNTSADYSEYKTQIEEAIDSFNYYNQGQNIRPVNGKYDKIGYFIYKNKVQ